MAVSTLASRASLAQNGDNPLALPAAETPVAAEPLLVAQPQPTPPTSGATATLTPAGQDIPTSATTRSQVRQNDELRVRGNTPAVTLDRFSDPAPARAGYALLADTTSPAQAETRRLQDQIRQATNALRSADGDQAKADATKRLTDLLNEYFESDVKHRESELAQVEERVKNLREQLNRRREKKQEIIDLQLKVAQNEADGLGFFNRPPENDGAFLNLFGGQPNPPARPFDVYNADQPNRRPGDLQPAQPPRPGGGARGGRGGFNQDEMLMMMSGDNALGGRADASGRRSGRGGRDQNAPGGRGDAGGRRGRDDQLPPNGPPQFMPQPGPPPRGPF